MAICVASSSSASVVHHLKSLTEKDFKKNLYELVYLRLRSCTANPRKREATDSPATDNPTNTKYKSIKPKKAKISNKKINN